MAAGGKEDASVDQLMAVTGVDRVIAANLLEACGGDLEMAVNMHMEDGPGPGPAAAQGAPLAATPPLDGEEDEVRAPIPQQMDQMIQPGYEGYALASRARGAGAARRVGTVRSVFDGFRDFEAETRRLEAEPEAEVPGLPVDRSKKRTLEELFKPPLDLMWQGDWQSARDQASNSKRWLLVNIQDAKEFQCQVLNRDLWSNPGVRAIVAEHFVFWQQYRESDQAARYMTFYRIQEWPHVSIVDPRTGESMVTWSRIDAAAFPDLITAFLSLHPSLESPGKEPARKRMRTDVPAGEMDEEAQMEAAIKASLADTLAKGDSDSGSDLETFSDDDSNQTTPTKPASVPPHPADHGPGPSNGRGPSVGAGGGWRDHLGKEGEGVETTTILIRWPDGRRESWTQPASSALAALLLFIESSGYSAESHEVVTNFPRRTLGLLPAAASLLALGLHPRETVFVQQRDA